MFNLPDSAINKIAQWTLITAKFSASSWFFKIRELTLLYGLPSPISMLQSPPSKTQFKNIIRSKITDYWEVKLRSEASALLSLRYFNPNYMSLNRPHPLWLTCTSNPYEIHKAVIQARMLSGRYQTEDLSKHWTDNKAGVCQLPGCSGSAVGSIEHLLLFCPALEPTRIKMMKLSYEVAARNEHSYHIISWVLSHPDRTVLAQFLLDCSSLTIVANMIQNFGSTIQDDLFYISRNWCYSLHRKRMDLLNLPQYC